jgi:hypothetical protein
MEASLDVKSMAATSTKVFILEVMGRHAGWMAASSYLARKNKGDAPHIILLPEVIFNQKKFLGQVKKTVSKNGYCVVVVSEGLKNNKNKFLAEADTKDAFGHAQLGGVAPYIANLITDKLKMKNHWAVSDYLQRSARHISSKTDLDQAMEVGIKAIQYAVKGMNGVMPIIVRGKGKKYTWKVEPAPLSKIANLEKKVLAVSGTHGKTTTSYMLTHILLKQGRDVGFLVGGISNNITGSASLGSDKTFVIEADEYDSAFFDKRSKFIHYSPSTIVINNMEFDHADIFNNLDDIKRQFHHLIKIIPSDGNIIYFGDDKNSKDLINMGVWSHEIVINNGAIKAD